MAALRLRPDVSQLGSAGSDALRHHEFRKRKRLGVPPSLRQVDNGSGSEGITGPLMGGGR